MKGNAPVVSIILPTKNSIRFLRERVESIRAQTFADYEVIVVDTASTDGTLELLGEWAAADARVSIVQAPSGIYQALNFGIARARGEYVYIATSDDTMQANALTKMVAALEAHPECDICDTRLMQIGEDGRELTPSDEEYLRCDGHLLFPRDRPCVRLPPLDFLMHCGGKTVYISLTQILVRKSLFEKTGPFPENYGPSADYMWGMRAALASPAVYIPEKLATWRMRSGQLTGHRSQKRNFLLMCRMADEVYAGIADPELKSGALRLRRLVGFKTFLLPIKRGLPMKEKFVGLIKAATIHPLWTGRFLMVYLYHRLVHGKYAGIRAYDYLYRREVIRALGRDWRRRILDLGDPKQEGIVV